MKFYQIQLEVSGPAAMWTRPDTGDHPVSYPAPTFSAIKGMIESILWWQSVNVVPQKVHICAPIQYHDYWNNYRGPLRKADLRSKGNAQQIKMSILIDVCYQFFIDVEDTPTHTDHLSMRAQAALKQTTNHLHAYYDVFHRRLTNGRWHRIPSLGLKEFVPTYIGPFRPETKKCEDINLEIPSMTYRTFEKGVGGDYRPVLRAFAINNGLIDYRKGESQYA